MGWAAVLLSSSLGPSLPMVHDERPRPQWKVAPTWPTACSGVFPVGLWLSSVGADLPHQSRMVGLALSTPWMLQARGLAILTLAPPGTPGPYHSKSGTDPGERKRRNHEPDPL